MILGGDIRVLTSFLLKKFSEKYKYSIDILAS